MGVEPEVTVSVSHSRVTSHLRLNGWREPLIVVHKSTGGQLGGSGPHPAQHAGVTCACICRRQRVGGRPAAPGRPHTQVSGTWLAVGWGDQDGTGWPPVSHSCQAGFQESEQKQGGLSEPRVGTSTQHLCHNLSANAGHRPALWVEWWVRATFLLHTQRVCKPSKE
ncbi:hypothetical protein HJG60_010719 [Phyllostomus discolor]|uniref:Uncharacterized protein n=1 Tax=Phyllostomus discolor TaxID=89673 RepID=A0A834APE2_9CHIR|nr:hypothetical protein HJG60_010719 [Phyllostomus discolor]